MLNLVISTRLTSNSWSYTYFCPPSAGVKDMQHHVQLKNMYFHKYTTYPPLNLSRTFPSPLSPFLPQAIALHSKLVLFPLQLCICFLFAYHVFNINQQLFLFKILFLLIL